jgi:lipopolysaccharide biosynthesis glycosyltransferase
MTLVFTLCSNNYLAHAITLGQSLKRHNPDYSFKIGLVDKKNPDIDYNSLIFEIIEVANIGISGLDKMINIYNITELNTSVKAFYFIYFFKSLKESDCIIYLDPDILIYNEFSDLDIILEKKEIVIVPHFTSPIDDNKFQAEEDFLNSGLYNLGFIAIKNSDSGHRLINWWSDRMKDKAFIDFRRGLFTDQIWINFVPLFFEGVRIFTHPGYNVAYWNLHERQIIENHKVLKNDKIFPLVFYHFSGFSPNYPDILSKYQDRYSFDTRKDILELFINYSERLNENGFNSYRQYPCYYVQEKERRDTDYFRRSLAELPFITRLVVLVTRKLIKLFTINRKYLNI